MDIKTEVESTVEGIFNLTDAIAHSEIGWQEVYPEEKRFSVLLDYLSTVCSVVEKYEGEEVSIEKEAFYLQSRSLKPCDAGLTSTTTSKSSISTTTTLETDKESDQTSTPMTTSTEQESSTATTNPAKNVIGHIRSQTCPPNIEVQKANHTITVGIIRCCCDNRIKTRFF